MKVTICISFLLLISCNQSPTNTTKIEDKTVVQDTVIKPISYEFKYDGMSIVVKGRGYEKKDYNGKIKFLENEIQIFNGNDGEKYFIKDFKREKNKLIFSTNNNKNLKATITVFVKQNKSYFEADFGNSVAKFNLTQGEFSEIPLYNKPKDEKAKTISSVDKKDSLYNWNKEYKSSKYSYSIKIPETFTKTEGDRPHIDLKFVDAFGSSILVNVSPRQQEEYSITAHDYTKDMLEQSYRQGAPNVVVTYSEKLMVGGEKAFLIEFENGFPNMKSMECYLFHKDLAYVITGTCEKSKFSKYRQLFKTGISSLYF